MTTSRWQCLAQLDGFAATHGLVIESVTHDGFKLADEIRVAAIWINPQATDPTLRKRLLLGVPDFELDGKLEAATTAAPKPFDAYEVEGAWCQKYVSSVVPGDRIFGEGMPPLYVQQMVRFGTYGCDPPHEPVGSLPAARLFPHLRFETTNPLIRGVRVDFELHLSFRDLEPPPKRKPSKPDAPAIPSLPVIAAPSTSQAGIFRDHDDLPFGVASILATLQLEDEFFNVIRSALDWIAANAAALHAVEHRELRRALEEVEALPMAPTAEGMYTAVRESLTAVVDAGIDVALELVIAATTALRVVVEVAYETSLTGILHRVKDFVLSIPVAAQLATEQVFAAAEKPVPFEIVATGLNRGKTITSLGGKDVATWDNIHVWPAVDRDEMLPSTPGAFYAAHMHWRWGRIAASPDAIEVLAQRWLGIMKSGHPVLSNPEVGGPLIDSALSDQTIRFALVTSDGGHAATGAAFDQHFVKRTAQPIRAGTDLAVWMSFEAHRTLFDLTSFGGTVFAHGLYFAHEPESPDNPFAWTFGKAIDPANASEWHRQPEL